MAMLNKNISTFIFFISILIGQNTKPTVAILDFEGQGLDVFSTSGSSTLDFLPECEMLDPDDNLIEIKGFAQGVVNAQ